MPINANVNQTKINPVIVILAVSMAAVLFLFWLIYFKPSESPSVRGSSVLPAVNALLNAASATCITLGIVFIRRRERKAHARSMSAAFCFSAAFLVCYIAYYWQHGNTVFTGQGWIRPIYFTVLISHIALSIVALPMVLSTFYFSLTEQFARHRRLARVTFPIWLYVSVTGVAVFFLVRGFA